MNELDIRARVDKLIQNAESEIEVIFSRALRTVLDDLEGLYSKAQKEEGSGEPSYTTLNRYNRIESLLKRISETMNEEYQNIVKEIQQLEENAYLETYLRTTYLFQLFQQEPMGFTIPTNDVLIAALINPIEALNLIPTLEVHRNQIVRQLQLVIQQGLLNGDGYSTIAAEIRRQLGFSRNKARTVARTEGARAQSLASTLTYEEQSETARIERIWLTALDLRVRSAHRTLDGQVANKEGLFRYRSYTSKGPLLWGVPELDINCRCVTIAKVNGMFPAVRRGRDYSDSRYQARLEKRMNELLSQKDKDGNKKYRRSEAFNKAFSEIQPPSVTVPYITYNKWLEEYGK